MKPNDIEIIELLLIKIQDSIIGKKIKLQLSQDDEFGLLLEDMEILIAAIKICARKTTLQIKISNLEKSNT